MSVGLLKTAHKNNNQFNLPIVRCTTPSVLHPFPALLNPDKDNDA